MLGVLLLCIFTISCGNSSDEPETELQTFQFMSYKQACYGIVQKLCLVESNDDSMLNFYSQIDGFDFVWGHTYTVQVIVTELTADEIYADGSSQKYELYNVISNDEDNVGSVYKYSLVELLSSTVTKESGIYYFLGQPFECSLETDCDALVELNNSGGYVNLNFKYAGNGQLILTSWD